RPPQLPPEFVDPTLQATQDIWNDAPWETLDEEKIIAIELNTGDVGTLYVSILGMLGMEYGLLMYRSLESLKKFRHRVLQAGDSPEELEGAFLDQDCLFLTFEQQEADPTPTHRNSSSGIAALDAEAEVHPAFGNLHPLEGMRSVLYEEEAEVMLLALRALHRFFTQHLHDLDVDTFPEIVSRYRLPGVKEGSKKVSVKVSTLPDVAMELAEMSGAELGLSSLDMEAPPILRNDLIPEDAFYSLGAMSWDIFNVLRTVVKFHQRVGDEEFPQDADGFPVILIQTSRPKATALIEELKAAGGVKAICFNPGEDPFSENRYDLGIVQTHNSELHLFGEFIEDDPVHIQARKKWDQRCKKTQGYCGLIIAKGLKGASRGNPQISDMLALFETRSLSSKDLGLGSLQLMPSFE
ncbi:MAG TPA: hypothetical protein V6C65_13460, partial [Allocoleopsis sp.]